MKPFLVSGQDLVRSEYLHSVEGKRVVVYGFSEPPAKPDLKAYELQSLFKDDVFFDAMATVDGSTTLFLWDLGPDIHCSKPQYLDAYTKLKPLSLQAGSVRIVDRLAFYFSPKSILRPFLYLTESPFGETLHRFYAADYEPNRVEQFAAVIKPLVDMRDDPIEIIIERYLPTEAERQDYERLKYDLIMVQRKSKTSVMTSLFRWIDKLPSRMEAVRNAADKGTLIMNNDSRKLRENYQTILGASGPVVFFSSGVFGLDEMSLETTLVAIGEHNRLVELLRNG